MKKLTLTFILFCFLVTIAWSQNREEFKIPLIGEKAISFTGESTKGTVNFPDDFGKKWKILFSHPKDFTPVCSSELLELASMQAEFDKLNTALVVISTDNLSQHKTWKESLETIDYQGNGKQKINFPLVADDNKLISMKYGMLHPSTNNTEDVRGVFIISPDNTVESITFYPMRVGRNIEELKRTLVALQTAKGNIVTPANWVPGDDVMLSYLTEEQKAELKSSQSRLYQIEWYMIFMKL